jgi:N-acetylmuramoyl-L-alanine amidase
MGLLAQGGVCRGCGWLGAVALVGLWGGGVASAGMRLEHAVEIAAKPAAGWDAAVEARAKFEAEPKRSHTREEYARVMNGFRAIYHSDPDNAHAAEAVAQVAELLNEQGREFGDKKNVHDAAGQYEYLAKAYPADKLAAEALGKALELLGPQDAEEVARVKAELVADYPQEAWKDGVGTQVQAAKAAGLSTALRSGRDDSSVARPGRDDSSGVGGQKPGSESLGSRHPAVVPDTPTSQMRDVGVSDVVSNETAVRGITEMVGKQAGTPSVVTGIRHWSTASYTRVAIDLNVAPGERVTYEAARVEGPDRIFFDLQHARLTPQLVGKSFNVTDDGFLERIRAAQFSDEVTRVVLDVHQVAEYSAFLLPNPYRLIIDIHGKQEIGSRKQEVAGAEVGASGGARDLEGVGTVTAPVSRGVGEASSLPPMPVTDGSASFGLPARGADRSRTDVAPQRVVISSKPTAAKPVPNTVVKSAADTGTEVAAVSEQPGVVEATRKPTSQPIVARSSDDGSGGEHYVARSRRKASDGGEGAASSHLREEVIDPPKQAENARSGPGVAKMGHSASSAGAEVKGEPATAPPPTADGGTSLMRALGLKIGRIVIDAGHGGHDSGTLGAGGIEEKDVVLDVALRLGKLLHDRLGAEVVYTRDDDTFIPLETRTAIANKAQADLFISVHANSSQDADVSGVEVYYLNFTSDPEAMTVASRENAVSTESVHELSDLVKKIALKDKIDESRELAADVDASLYAGLRKGNADLKNRGVKKAPFVVLIGANMPSILAEISFVTNPSDAAKLETPVYRERVAESLYKGIARYAEGINGGKPRAGTVEQAER